MEIRSTVMAAASEARWSKMDGTASCRGRPAAGGVWWRRPPGAPLTLTTCSSVAHARTLPQRNPQSLPPIAQSCSHCLSVARRRGQRAAIRLRAHGRGLSAGAGRARQRELGTAGSVGGRDGMQASFVCLARGCVRRRPPRPASGHQNAGHDVVRAARRSHTAQVVGDAPSSR